MKMKYAPLELPPLRECDRPTAHQIEQSVTADMLISFIDGKPRRVLKRHLAEYGLDPDSYRQRYGLPRSYPMIAPAYAAARRELAVSLGLEKYLRSE